MDPGGTGRRDCQGVASHGETRTKLISRIARRDRNFRKETQRSHPTGGL